MTALHIDFETASKVELKDAGLHNYATDCSTSVHCMAFDFSDAGVQLWTPATPEKQIAGVLAYVKKGGAVYAHNAAFELAIWNSVCVPRYGWPILRPEQCRCTMAMAYAMALPGALENVAPALGLGQRKDAVGKRIMLKLAKPKADGTLWKYEDSPDDFDRLYAYCGQDVVVERAVHKRLLELSPYEQKLWELDYEINQRGFQVDLEGIDAAIRLVEVEKARLDNDMLKTTGGVVGACTEVQLLVKWIRTQGVALPGLAKADVLDALSDEGLPVAVRRALELRREAAKSSTAKLIAMRDRASADGRVRGTKQYHGAATGRWAGRGVQPDNFARPRKGMKPKHIADIIAHFADRNYIDTMYGPVMDAIVDALRAMIIAAPGKDLIEMDFSAIEARVLAWLAGEQKVLDLFIADEDIYIYAAAAIFHCAPADVKDWQRQIGKVAVLALGYGGGKGAFQSMAKNYGVKVADAEAEDIKAKWRGAHPRTVKYWYALEEAAIRAVEEGGVQCVGPIGRQIKFKVSGSFLFAQLPSGRVLTYPYPEIRPVETPWGDIKQALTFMTELDSTARKKAKLVDDPNANGKWCRIATYGGSLAENFTQAVARDLLANALINLKSAGYDICMHIHDSAVVEIATSCEDNTLHNVEELMCKLPAWAAGLPLKAEGWRARRFQK